MLVTEILHLNYQHTLEENKNNLLHESDILDYILWVIYLHYLNFKW